LFKGKENIHFNLLEVLHFNLCNMIEQRVCLQISIYSITFVGPRPENMVGGVCSLDKVKQCQHEYAQWARIYHICSQT
jgi:hypothetical protein